MDKVLKIPVFPLPVVVFPDEEIRLHIFEQRYKQLIQDCSDTGLVFAILPIVDDRIQEYGTLVRLKEIVKTYEDGRFDIRLEAIGQVKNVALHNRWSGKLYGAIDAQAIDDISIGDQELLDKIKQQFGVLCEINQAQPYHSILWEQFRSYKLGHYVGFTLKEEYQFSTLKTENERLQKLLNQLKLMIAQSTTRKEWLKNMNMNGEFRNFGKESIKGIS